MITWTRLEAARLQGIGEAKQKEARALESIPDDRAAEVMARGKRAAAEEFFAAVEEIGRRGPR